MFSWPVFLRQQQVPFAGPNNRGWIEFHCPLCGPADAEMHMGVHVRSGRWHCWRNESHRGSDAASLVQTMLRCSLAEARSIVSAGEREVPSDDDLSLRLRRIFSEGEEPEPSGPLDLAAEGLRSLDTDNRFAGPFLEYLRQRGYYGTALKWLIETYNLHYAIRGPFAYRIVFPIYNEHRQLVTWTGRSIRKGDELRYLSLPVSRRPRFKQVAKVAVNQTLLGLPYLLRCSEPSVLAVCEGPFDATRVECYGRAYGVHATCLFGLAMSDPQREQLLALQRRFNRVVLLLDATAGLQAFKLAHLGGMDFERYLLPDAIKDPGELSAVEALDLSIDLTQQFSS